MSSVIKAENKMKVGGKWESHYIVTVIVYRHSPERLWLETGAAAWARRERQKLREQEGVRGRCEQWPYPFPGSRGDGLNHSVKGTRSLRWIKGLNARWGPSLLPPPSLQLFPPVLFAPNSSVIFQAWLYAPWGRGFSVSCNAMDAL